MKKLILLVSCAALASCGDTAQAPAENTVVNDVAVEEVAADKSVLGTTWTFSDETGSFVETIDADGNYIVETVDGEHADHGTATMDDSTACFTSAMDDEGAECWEVPTHAVGDTITVSSDKAD